MPAIFYRALNLLALLVVTAWWGSARDWEPFAAMLTLLATLGWQEYRASTFGDDHDRELYKKFLAEFPSGGRSVTFLKDHDMGAPYHDVQLEEFKSFVRSWDNAECEFHNELLNSYLRTLKQKAREFDRCIDQYIFANSGGLRTMDLADYETDPKKLLIKKELNDFATAVYDAHQTLVRQGRKLL